MKSPRSPRSGHTHGDHHGTNIVEETTVVTPREKERKPESSVAPPPAEEQEPETSPTGDDSRPAMKKKVRVIVRTKTAGGKTVASAVSLDSGASAAVTIPEPTKKRTTLTKEDQKHARRARGGSSMFDAKSAESQKMFMVTMTRDIDGTPTEELVTQVFQMAGEGDADKFERLISRLRENSRTTVSDVLDWASEVDGKTALHIAAETGFALGVRMLLELDVRKSSPDSSGNTPLHLAIRSRHESVALILVEKAGKQGVVSRNKSGNTPLHFAIVHEMPAVVDALLGIGADANSLNEMGETPLHNACSLGNLAAVEKLLDSGALPNIGDKFQRTPLHILAMSPTLDDIVQDTTQLMLSTTIASTLVKHEANVATLDKYSHPALFYAIETGKDGLVNYLLQVQGHGDDITMVYEVKSKLTRTKRNASVTAEGEDATPARVSPLGVIEQTNQDSPSTPLTKKDLDRDRRYAARFVQFVNAWDKIAVSDQKKLCHWIRKYVPRSIRGALWKNLLNVAVLEKRFPNTYSLMLNSRPKASVVTQIDLDVKRAHQNHIFFSEEYGHGQTALFNILRAYSLHDQIVGYTQGMADVAGVLLIYLAEEDAFWGFCQLMTYDKWGMQKLFVDGFNFLWVLARANAKILKMKYPRIYKHLVDHLNIDLAFIHPYLFEWFMVLFSRVLPYELVFHIFDIVLADGYLALLNIAMTLFYFIEAKLLAINDDNTLLQQLKHPMNLLSPTWSVIKFSKFYIKNGIPMKELEKIVEVSEKEQKLAREKS